jgi:hypothetical protein
MTERERQLAELFKTVEAEFPDKSTAFVLEVTAERARIQGIKRDCDCSDVADALFNET